MQCRFQSNLYYSVLGYLSVYYTISRRYVTRTQGSAGCLFSTKQNAKAEAVVYATPCHGYTFNAGLTPTHDMYVRTFVYFVFLALLYLHQNELPALRRELQKDLRTFIKRVGPELGPIYTDPDLNWGDLFRMQKVYYAPWPHSLKTPLTHGLCSTRYYVPDTSEYDCDWHSRSTFSDSEQN